MRRRGHHVQPLPRGAARPAGNDPDAQAKVFLLLGLIDARSSSAWASACLRVRESPARRAGWLSARDRRRLIRGSQMNINLPDLDPRSARLRAFHLVQGEFIWPPLMRAIEQRQKQIADGLAAGEQGGGSLEAAGKRAHEELAKARERVGEIIGSAEKARRADARRGEGRRQGRRPSASSPPPRPTSTSRSRAEGGAEGAGFRARVSGAEKIPAPRGQPRDACRAARPV